MAPGLSEAVATAVLSRFNSLPKTGKPTAGEYTLLAGFAVSDEATPDVPPRVVALGTGTKCLPAASRCSRGEALSDSHAEVLARRALKHFLYDEMERVLEGNREEVEGTDAPPEPIVTLSSDDASHNNDKNQKTTNHAAFALRPGVNLHMYVTQSPCGDASIFNIHKGQGNTQSSNGDTEDNDDKPNDNPKYALSGVDALNESIENPLKKSKRAKTVGVTNLGIGATGAKMIVTGTDTRNGDNTYDLTLNAPTNTPAVDKEHLVTRQELSVCRVKPGRGALTNCMSCSDKLCRWISCGVQGGLLSRLIESPVCIATITVACPEQCADGGDVTRNAENRHNVLRALGRALTRGGLGDETDRASSGPSLHLSPPPPFFLSSTSGQTKGLVSASCSVNWVYRWNKHGEIKTEVTLGATGKKSGYSKKSENSQKAVSRLSRLSLARRFVKVVGKVGVVETSIVESNNVQTDTSETNCPTSTPTTTTYGWLKKAAVEYVSKTNAFREKNTFQSWSVKNEKEKQFCLY